jgi:hypothetical protein
MMDNLSAHKGSRLRGIVAGRGCELIYLPPYSSPVSQPYLKEAFAKFKKSLLLRRAGPGAARLWWRRWARLWTPSR